jgi:hypothetical protein
LDFKEQCITRWKAGTPGRVGFENVAVVAVVSVVIVVAKLLLLDAVLLAS